MHKYFFFLFSALLVKEKLIEILKESANLITLPARDTTSIV